MEEVNPTTSAASILNLNTSSIGKILKDLN